LNVSVFPYTYCAMVLSIKEGVVNVRVLAAARASDAMRRSKKDREAMMVVVGRGAVGMGFKIHVK